VFSYVCCKCFYLDVAIFCNAYTRVFKVLLVFCKCFRRMLQVFQLFRTYIISVSSECYKKGPRMLHMLNWTPWRQSSGAAARVPQTGRQSSHAVGRRGRHPCGAGRERAGAGNGLTRSSVRPNGSGAGISGERGVQVEFTCWRANGPQLRCPVGPKHF